MQQIDETKWTIDDMLKKQGQAAPVEPVPEVISEAPEPVADVDPAAPPPPYAVEPKPITRRRSVANNASRRATIDRQNDRKRILRAAINASKDALI